MKTHGTAGRTAALAATLALLAACENARDPAATVAAAPDPAAGNPYAWVGEYHNRGMDFVLRELQAQGRDGWTRESACEAVAGAAERYVAGARPRIEATGSLQEGLRLGGCRQDAGAGSEFEPPRLYLETAGLSPQATSLLYQIHGLVGSSYPLPDVFGQLGQVNGTAAATLSPGEAEVVLAVSAVAAFSVVYWESELSAWGSLMSVGGHDLGMDGVMSFTGSPGFQAARRIAMTDVVGGVAGAGRAFYLGAGGILAAAAASSFGASLGASVAEIMNLTQF
jgi:hypothetical protein